MSYTFGPLNNFTAVVPPTVNNDNTEGYSPGSMWFDNSAGILYILTDSTTGAAIWQPFNPQTSIFACDASLSVGDAVKISALTDLLVEKADASTFATAKCIGIIQSKPTTTTCQLTKNGIVGGYTGIVKNQVYLLSETAGELSTTIPTASGTVINPIAIGVSTTQVEAQIANTLIIRD